MWYVTSSKHVHIFESGISCGKTADFTYDEYSESLILEDDDIEMNIAMNSSEDELGLTSR